jgi:predicted transcriptional regulator of viral defense system
MGDIAGLSKESREKLARVLRKARGTISVEQAAASLGLSRKEAAKKLSQWAQQGWLSRVRRGLYVPVPLESKSADVALEDPWIIAERLFSPCYIGGWSAAEHWDLTEQIFRSIMVMTTKKPRDRRPVIKSTAFVLRSISPDAFFGTKPIWRGPVKVNVSDPTRTVLDMLSDPSLGGGLRPTTDVFRAYLKSTSKDLQLLVSFAERLGSGAVYKRLGFLLERFVPDEKAIIGKCRARISAGNTKLDPSLPAERLVTRWRLWVPDNWTREQKRDRPA